MSMRGIPGVMPLWVHSVVVRSILIARVRVHWGRTRNGTTSQRFESNVAACIADISLNEQPRAGIRGRCPLKLTQPLLQIVPGLRGMVSARRLQKRLVGAEAPYVPVEDADRSASCWLGVLAG